ncbi:MAG TPA: aminotransferase class I/II-fold pyridoxal phosphate-dependent enzyme [Clostridiaceae bacterium]|nr:aminotransferase class I/II-fold pyridoxal phosphate-dependent enzyme [Clostridiaceae bacterium]
MTFPEYQHGGDIYGITGIRKDFSINLNPLGMPAAVQQAICDNVSHYDVYPDPYCRELATKLAARWGFDLSWLCFGNGAADLIFRLFFALKPRRMLTLAPTFSEYEEAAKLVDCDISYYYLSADKDFVLAEDILTLITKDLDLVFICNPNNPTGLLAQAELMTKLVKRCADCGVVLAVDECFMPFTTGRSLRDQLLSFDNLIIFRAFTKIYSMAGLRLGYIMCSNEKLVHSLRRIAQPWAVSTVAQVAALAALDVPDWIKDTVRLVATERERVASGLERLGLKVFRGEANYILFCSQFPLDVLLRERGILIRSCANFVGLDQSYYRIGIKTREENSYLLRQLESVLTSV